MEGGQARQPELGPMVICQMLDHREGKVSEQHIKEKRSGGLGKGALAWVGGGSGMRGQGAAFGRGFQKVLP